MTAAPEATATPTIEVLPSILSADFAALGSAVEEVVAAGAKVIHCDIMDGRFVPPITFGPQVVAALRERLPDDIYLDVHCMIDTPERQVEAFASAGASSMTFHAEATPHVHRILQHIRELGMHAGLAVCPGTPVEVFAQVTDLLDVALCMTVNPGWGGQKLIPSTIAKTATIAGGVSASTIVEVDGGIDVHSAPDAVRAGAHWLVAGSAVFGAADPAAAFQAITSAARGAAA